uniref:Uncharacterized protein n=1 Tax=Candidatus Kentrum sp. TC TaxID=2126339 RepID=A0A450Z1V0_9GAMM|nr:MAG: hypothetical protein BECKTC1821E_GA0114239_10944 [Candidatus Kentron sp. TC]
MLLREEPGFGLTAAPSAVFQRGTGAWMASLWKTDDCFQVSGGAVWWFRLEKMVWKVYRRDHTPFPLDVGISHYYEATPKYGGYAWARGASPLLPFRDYSVTGGAMLRHRRRSYLSRVGEHVRNHNDTSDFQKSNFFGFGYAGLGLSLTHSRGRSDIPSQASPRTNKA